MRKLGIALGVVAGLLLIATLVLLYTFDANRQSGMLSSQIEAALGRKVKFGTIRLGLFPPSLNVRDAEIADAFGFKDPVFSTAKTFRMRVRLIPLLRGRVEVPSIELDEPAIHLVKNSKGEWNFASLGTAAEPRGKSAPAASAEGQRPLEIEELRLRNGVLTVDDLQKNTPRITLDRISLTVKNFARNQPFDWEVSVHPPGPEAGEVRASGRGGPLAKANAAASPVQGHAEFFNVALESLAAFTGQTGLAGIFDGETEFHSDGSKAEAKGTFKVAKLRLAPDRGVAQAPVSGHFDVAALDDASRLLIRRFDVLCGKATAHATGQVKFGPQSRADIRSNVANAPLADVAKLFPMLGVKLPAGSSLTEGTLTATAQAAGPVAALKRTGSVDIRNARLTGYSVAGQLASALRLMGVDTGGRDTAIESLQLTFDADESYTRIPSATLRIPGMDITGQGGFDRPGALDFRGSVVLTRASAAVGGLLQKVTGSSNTVPFRIGGTLDKPAFRPDVEKIMTQQMGGEQSGSGNQLLKGLGSLFGKKKQ